MLTASTAPLDIRPTAWVVRVQDLSLARDFYGGLLGCREEAPVDGALSFDLFGEALAIWPEDAEAQVAFGAARLLKLSLSLPQWRNLAQRLMAAGMRFDVPPHCEHEGRADACWTLSIRDPGGNVLEIRASDAAAPRWH